MINDDMIENDLIKIDEANSELTNFQRQNMTLIDLNKTDGIQSI